MTRPYLTTGRLVALTEELSVRDLDVVATLARLRLATTRQLERLHWSTGEASPLTQARHCRRSLERLTALGVLARLDRRIGGVRAGSASFVYTLGPAGQRLHGGRGPAGGSRIRKPWTPGFGFLAHGLAVSELYVRLVEAERDCVVEVGTFEAEPTSWRQFTAGTGGTAVLKPDAFVVTARGDIEEHRFCEVDRATESLIAVGRKLSLYRQYWASGTEQHRHGIFPGVLWIVPDNRRRAAVVHECSRQPAEAWHLFQVVVWQDALAVFTGEAPE